MKKPLFSLDFRYPNGEDLRKGDKVLALGRLAVVEAVFGPNTQMARVTCYGNEGGFILQFDDGDRQVWLNTEDRIELLLRG